MHDREDEESLSERTGGLVWQSTDHQEDETERSREDLRQRISDWLDLPLAILALVWAALVVVELAFALPPTVSGRILQVDFAIWLVFAAVFLVELLLAPRKLQYLRGNLLSALSIVLPFVRVVRVLRLARVLRSASLVRLVLVANRSTRAAGEIFSQHRFQYVFSIIVLTTLLAAAGVYYFEAGVPGTPYGDLGDALWWAATMTTTVNIGDEPLTLEGRVIGLLLRVVGLATFGYFTASVASFFIGERVAEREAPRKSEQVEQTEAIARLTEEVKRLRSLVEALSARPVDQETGDGGGGRDRLPEDRSHGK